MNVHVHKYKNTVFLTVSASEEVQTGPLFDGRRGTSCNRLSQLWYIFDVKAVFVVKTLYFLRFCVVPQGSCV